MNDFESAIAAHDAALSALGIDIWIGAEPTFTDRFVETPEWLSEALGGDKEDRALGLLVRLAECRPGAAVLRTLGRQYSGEARPRWSFGLYERRNGTAAWTGAKDPALVTEAGPAAPLQPFAEALIENFAGLGWSAARVSASEPDRQRLAFRVDGGPPETDPAVEPRLLRASIHDRAISEEGLADDLSATGIHLLVLGYDGPDPDTASMSVELPQLDEVDAFLDLLTIIGNTARHLAVDRMILKGFPPPADATVAWTTITPDPAVLEINQAPAPDAMTFLRWNRALFDAAHCGMLAPYRVHYNGTITDSGGGGQITFGGSAPERSPFFVHSQTLPRLVRYLNRHPALSYWFAPPYLGAGSQAPRPDEGVRDLFAELGLTLELLARMEAIEPLALWQSLSPFLCDPAGNAHRSELNIEKLWNPYLASRGQQGLVEFRAFRMARSAESMTALAVLLRSIVAMLGTQDMAPELVDWCPDLHDRFALPFYLHQDLSEIFDDLQNAGLGLTGSISERLLEDNNPRIGHFELNGCTLEISQALEFWPLIGDTTAPSGSGSRLVDASTARIQVLLRTTRASSLDPSQWQLSVDNTRIPLIADHDAGGEVRLLGLRYRNFKPSIGLHPAIPGHGPIQLHLTHPELADILCVTLHEWRPDGRPYPGLPADFDDAEHRRSERVLAEVVPRSSAAAAGNPRSTAVSHYSLDLRRL